MGQAGGSKHARIFGFGLAALALLTVACGDEADVAGAGGAGAGDDDGERMRVVASTALLAEFATHVAGDDAEVTSIIPPGVDVHSFHPPTSAARDVATADVLLVNGYNLEEGVLSVIAENRRDDAHFVVVAAGLDPLEGGHPDEEHADDEHADEEHADEARADEEPADVEGLDELAVAEGDPHFWLDVANAVHYVEQIRDALAEADPANSAAYRERAAAYIATLEGLDAEVRERIESVPEERRTLVVFHDAFGYFARAYDLELVAAILPSSANAEASAASVAEVVRLVREREIPAVFGEPQFSAGTLDLVAEETGAAVATLYSDAGSDDVTSYVEMMRANAEAIATALGGTPGG